MKQRLKDFLEWFFKIAGGTIAVSTFIAKFGFLAILGLTLGATAVATILA